MGTILMSAELWGFLGMVATGIISFFVGKAKNKAEAKGIEVHNDKEILNTYKTELEYFSTQLDKCREEISELRETINELLQLGCERKDCPRRIAR